MKKIIVTSLLAGMACISVWAAPNNTNSITIYSKPATTADKVAEINSQMRLVPFYRQGQWVKVGDHQTGKVGWVKLPTPPKVTVIKPEVTSDYIQVQQQNGAKPQIIAYKDGKKLDPKQAQAMYQKMQMQQQKWQQQFDKLQQQMNQSFAEQDKMMQQMMQNFPVMTQVVVTAPQPNAQDQGRKQAQTRIHQNFNTMTGHIFSAKKAIQDYHQQKAQWK